MVLGDLNICGIFWLMHLLSSLGEQDLVAEGPREEVPMMGDRLSVVFPGCGFSVGYGPTELEG